MLIKNSNLSEASFMETDIKNIYFEKVDLNRVEFIRTKLKDIDFSDADISSTIFDLNSLKGIIIDRFQCQNIVGMLGVKIKD